MRHLNTPFLFNIFFHIFPIYFSFYSSSKIGNIFLHIFIKTTKEVIAL
nr:MAG TPA: hypothetical protein [Caudoviricetes sp.]